MNSKAYSRIAQLLVAIDNCENSNNTEWKHKHQDRLESIVERVMPHGSGFDSGCKLLDESTPERLVFSADFHHMNDGGYYDGWSEHTVIVQPSLAHGFSLRVTGRNRNDIKDYIAETMEYALNSDIAD